jgi:hypothetical protein
MSLAIENYTNSYKGSVDELAVDISELENFSKINTKNKLFAPQDVVIEKIESIMFDVLNRDTLELEKLISDFFDLVIMSGLDLQTLYKLYVGKNILNQFRQDNGYKDGSYIKVWAGEEDNVVMKRVLDESSDISPNELYNELTKLYLALNKS